MSKLSRDSALENGANFQSVVSIRADDLTCRCPHNRVGSAQRAVLLISTLDFDDTTYAENMLTSQADRAVGNSEADGAQVIADLRDNRHQIRGHLSADIFGHGARQKLVRMDLDRKRLRNSQTGSLIEFCLSVSLAISLPFQQIIRSRKMNSTHS